LLQIDVQTKPLAETSQSFANAGTMSLTLPVAPSLYSTNGEPETEQSRSRKSRKLEPDPSKIQLSQLFPLSAFPLYSILTCIKIVAYAPAMTIMTIRITAIIILLIAFVFISSTQSMLLARLVNIRFCTLYSSKPYEGKNRWKMRDLVVDNEYNSRSRKDCKGSTVNVLPSLDEQACQS